MFNTIISDGFFFLGKIAIDEGEIRVRRIVIQLNAGQSFPHNYWDESDKKNTQSLNWDQHNINWHHGNNNLHELKSFGMNCTYETDKLMLTKVIIQHFVLTIFVFIFSIHEIRNNLSLKIVCHLLKLKCGSMLQCFGYASVNWISSVWCRNKQTTCFVGVGKIAIFRSKHYLNYVLVSNDDGDSRRIFWILLKHRIVSTTFVIVVVIISTSH